MSRTSDWVESIVDVATLKLDLQNPRLPKKVRDHKDIVAVRNYLIEHESVLDIANKIASKGYHKSAVSIVTMEGGQYIVLDGNRRLAACQLLLDPNLAKRDSDRRKLEQWTKTYNKEELSRIKITIAPSRKAAEREIWDIHVNKTLKAWEQLQRLRMYKNLIDGGEFTVASAAVESGTTESKFSKELVKLFFYEWILELGGAASEDKMRDAGFNGIDRLIMSTNGKKLLKYSVTSDGTVTFEDDDDAKEKLLKLIPFIIGDNKISPQADQEQLIKTVYAVIDPKSFGQKKKAHKPTSSKVTPKTKGYHKIPKPQTPQLPIRARKNSRKYSLAEASFIVSFVLNHFESVVENLQERHAGRVTLSVKDEYDVQDLLRSILALFFDDVVAEQHVPSGGAASSRIDFVFLDNGTVIETKTTQTRSGANLKRDLSVEINDDIQKYSDHPKQRYLYFFIYDPEKKINNPGSFERYYDSKLSGGSPVKVIINRG